MYAAVHMRVQIISMSWTIDRNDFNREDIDALEDAIGAAANANILMFCAASDQGVAPDNSFPGACANKKIFKIGAADPSGAASNKVGDKRPVDFFFPGQNVMQGYRKGLTHNKAFSGSSIATALAAALAALVLHCVQAAALDTEAPAGWRTRGNGVIKRSDFEQLKQHELMKKAFQNMCSNSEVNAKFLEVWRVFEPALKDHQNGDDRMQILTKVAETIRTNKDYPAID